jgi:hypothetical protein
MTDVELLKMARLAQRDARMGTGALYGALADHIKELEAKLAKAVEALQVFKDFDDLPLECKRPDVFEIKVRKPILAALAELKGEKE